jgi:regulator of cell morphogenesis and NO signaling
MTKLRCVERLVSEHREAERQLIKLQISIEDAPPQQSGSVQPHETPEQLAEAFRNHLRLHLRKEDEVLFPLLERIFPGEASPLVVMSKEHEKINEAYEMLLLSLSEQHPAALGTGLPKSSRSIRSLLQVTLTHFGKEEEILFPAAELHLTQEEDRQVLQKWESFSGNSTNSAHAQGNTGS